MKRFRNLGYVIALTVAGLVLAALAARAGGPLLVGGPGFVEGLPFRFDPNQFPLTYWTDQGNLGNQTNTQANNLVAQAFQVWQDVPTATISFTRQGDLGQDIQTRDDYLALENDLNNCSQAFARPRSIVYDADGSLFRSLGEDETSVLGFAFAACLDSNGTDNFFTRGYAVLNGLWIDGSGSLDSITDPEIPLSLFRGVFVHEFGHLIGLDHSQVNLNCDSVSGCPAADLAGVPTMFPFIDPFIGNNEILSLSADDVATLSELYPTADFAGTTGRIHGHILFSDGMTPAQGFNVVARRVDDPRRIAVASVSGFLFTEDEGNPVYPWPGSPFGSRDPTLIGFYETPGLAAGDYTIEVEAIDPEFAEGSSINPIGVLGFQFPMPGSCASEFANTSPPESDADACSDQTSVPVMAGMVTDGGTDIILNGTPPRFDAWEDE